MPAKREDASIPAWSGDRLDAGCCPEIEEPYFDDALQAWVLSRHTDVLAALRAPGLLPAGAKNKVRADLDPGRSIRMRQETLDALSPLQLQVWRDRLIPEVHALIARLPAEQPVDLLGQYARPLCLALAALVTRLDLTHAKDLEQKARQVSAAAAEPYDQALRDAADLANAALRNFFSDGPETLRDSGFVALSQTLPHLVGNVWYALLQHPHVWQRIHAQPELMEQAIEELLRYACLVRILFRTALQDVEINGHLIHQGERVVLRVFAANRDPEHFARANEMDVSRRGAGHLALGAGPHSCVGASLIRMAVTAMTFPLLTRFAEAKLASPVEWSGGSGFRFPSSLFVFLHE